MTKPISGRRQRTLLEKFPGQIKHLPVWIQGLNLISIKKPMSKLTLVWHQRAFRRISNDTDVCLFCHTQLWGRYWLHRRVLFIPHTRLWEWFLVGFFCLAKPWQHKHVMCMPNTGVRLLCQTQLSEIFWLEILRVIFDFGCMWLLCQPSLWVLFCFCFLPTISLRMTDLYKYAIMTTTVINFKNRCAWLLCHTWLLVQI